MSQKRGMQFLDTMLKTIRSLPAFIKLYEILNDFIVIASLLLSLTMIHNLLHWTPLSHPYKDLFQCVHESVFMVNYLLFAWKSILRFVRTEE